ncbi:helix-turn-helix domain-containing protein [Brevibacillus sp. FIR094]|uniref:helix-turn-helix domain-containing protein n=1 Tax=Brevibacillus sp. FIR094 TaxID=3134809 RepID=UPI003D1FAF86
MKRRVSERVKELIEQRGLSRRQIAQAINYPSNVFDRWVMGTRPFNLKALIATTEYLSLPKDYFLPDYLYDCWHAPKDKLERITEFLCYTREENFFRYTMEIVSLALEDGKHLDIFYATGVILEAKGLQRDAEYFYTLVIDNERNRLAEHLALSYYRRFMVVRDRDMDHAYEAATKLGEHLRMLPEEVMFEAYTNIMSVFYVLDKWDHLIKYGEEAKSLMDSYIERHIFLYAKCLNYLGFAYRNTGDFQKALNAHRLCGELPGDIFKIWSELNSCVVHLQSGQGERVHELINLMGNHHEEAYNHLIYVLGYLTSKELYDKIEETLSIFSESIKLLFEKNDPINKKMSVSVRLMIAKFHLYKGNQTEAARLVKDAFVIVRKLKLNNLIVDCVRLLGMLREGDIATICSEI